VIDLHTHSTVSDGSDPPAAVAALAHRAGCRAFALTDHDRLDGIAEARREATRLGVELVPGCELSCQWEPGTFHLLVYFVEPGDGPLADALARLQQVRADRNVTMVARLAGLGLPITMEEVEAEAGGEGVGRPHMAAVLVAKGAADSVQDAFDRWLARGRPGYVDKARLSVTEAAALARQAGGVAVIAHPVSLGLEGSSLESTLRQLAEDGVAGLESYYGRYSPPRRRELVELARRCGMVATGGSDHHGRYKPDLTVGRGTGDLEVPDSVLEELEARRPR